MSTAANFRRMALVSVFALIGGQAMASCINPPAPPEQIAQFKSDTVALASALNSAADAEIATRDIVGTEPDLAADIVRIAEGNPLIQGPIAAGLAQAALACAGVDPQAAQTIQQAAAGFDDASFQSAFASVVGDLSTAAVAAAGASAVAGFGSVAGSMRFSGFHRSDRTMARAH